MDRNVWMLLAAIIRRAARREGRPRRRPEFSDALIVLMFFWAVWHDRPMCWACDRLHYGRLFRPRRLPSISRFSRRLRSPRVQRILQRVHDALAAGPAPAPLAFIDGKALPVSESTKDKQARSGRGAGRYSRGYRLHALVSCDRRVPVWAVTPMNNQEMTVAHELIRGRTMRGLTLADGNYDSGPLYDQIDRAGGVLITPQRMKSRSDKQLAKTPPSRRAVILAWRSDRQRMLDVYQLRGGVERTFGNAVSFAGGLGPLPPFVRTLNRVRRWVGVKLCIYHARLIVRRQTAA